jgi:hypothetical protein
MHAGPRHTSQTSIEQVSSQFALRILARTLRVAARVHTRCTLQHPRWDVLFYFWPVLFFTCGKAVARLILARIFWRSRIVVDLQ